jgi:NAD(P) transhydrogenase subunit alpha
MAVVVGVLKETAANETRVAVVPEIAAKLKGPASRSDRSAAREFAAHFPDQAYADAEFSDAATILGERRRPAEGQPPSLDEVAALKKARVVVGFMQAYARPDLVRALKDRGITSFAMELVPRISRAQSMDALSSQASVAGYKAVLIAANTLERFLPMLTTAAGTIRPASVLVIGAGVAGLQAIATAKRLGAVVEAYDVRSATKDQVKSLGAKFVETGVSAEGAGGYARELTAEEKAKQQEVLDARIAASDAVISTASVPGRAAPRIISRPRSSA